MQITDNNILIKRTSNVLSNRLDNEIVMMSAENGEYYGLDPIATRIWELIEKPIAIIELVGQLTNEFDVKAEECSKDVLDFLQKLKEKNLIELCEAKNK